MATSTPTVSCHTPGPRTEKMTSPTPTPSAAPKTSSMLNFRRGPATMTLRPMNAAIGAKNGFG